MSTAVAAWPWPPGRVLSVSPTQNREEWKSFRRACIGSSDTPAILGYDPYKSPGQVWDRIVLGEWKEHDGPDLRRGIRQEPNARDCFCETTGLAVSEVGMVVHAEHRRIVTDIDGMIERPMIWPDEISTDPMWDLVRDLVGGPGWLEIKVPRPHLYYRYRNEGLPREYIAQSQHHGEVTGLSWGVFAFYNVVYDEVFMFPVLTDTEWGAWLVTYIHDWWTQHVTARDRPLPKPATVPRWPASIPARATIREDTEWATAAEAFTDAYFAEEAAVRRREAEEASLLALLEDDEQFVCGAGVTVKRYSTPTQRRTNHQKIRAALKLAQKDNDLERLMEIDPDSEEFKYDTQPTDKVKVYAERPFEWDS